MHHNLCRDGLTTVLYIKPGADEALCDARFVVGLSNLPITFYFPPNEYTCCGGRLCLEVLSYHIGVLILFGTGIFALPSLELRANCCVQC